jgi:hypothetical protein
MHNQYLIKQIKRINIIFVLSYLLYAAALIGFYLSLGINAAIAGGIVALALELTLIYELNQYKRELKQFINWEKRGF